MENKIEIVGITETHIPGGIFHWEGEQFILEGKGRNISNKGGGGVAIMIQKKRMEMGKKRRGK